MPPRRKKNLEPAPVVLHFVWWDEPSARSRHHAQRAVCGLWVAPNEVSLDRDRVTCPDCKKRCDEFEALDI
jgi:hypothetical protein